MEGLMEGIMEGITEGMTEGLTRNEPDGADGAHGADGAGGADGAAVPGRPRRRCGRCFRSRACMSLILAAALAVAAQFAAGPAHAAEPGSSGDPIALKSYVDEQVAALSKRVEQLESENEALQKAAQGEPGAAQGGDGAGNAPGAGSPGTFEVLFVTSGQRMAMGAGTELVMRTGGALAIRGELGCVVDLIDGADLDGGAAVKANHLLISARDDNRGVRFTSDAYILVKGDYVLR